MGRGRPGVVPVRSVPVDGLDLLDAVRGFRPDVAPVAVLTMSEPGEYVAVALEPRRAGVRAQDAEP